MEETDDNEHELMSVVEINGGSGIFFCIFLFTFIIINLFIIFRNVVIYHYDC